MRLQVREVKHRDPESIARYGLPLLQSKSGIPDEECKQCRTAVTSHGTRWLQCHLELLWCHVRNATYPADWTLHEQVAIAALECGAHSKAAGLINSVLKQFPDSMRARRLQVGSCSLKLPGCAHAQPCGMAHRLHPVR
jgi:hypothetical protein